MATITFHLVAVVPILGLATLAIACWWNAWSLCPECKAHRAHCKCGGHGDIRKPKWSDPRTGKKWDDE